jgi:hypothetical protein
VCHHGRVSSLLRNLWPPGSTLKVSRVPITIPNFYQRQTATSCPRKNYNPWLHGCAGHQKMRCDVQVGYHTGTLISDDQVSKTLPLTPNSLCDSTPSHPRGPLDYGTFYQRFWRFSRQSGSDLRYARLVTCLDSRTPSIDSVHIR